MTTVVAVAGIAGTLLGSLLSPIFADMWRRRGDTRHYIKTSRLAPYSAFTSSAEALQLQLDRRVGGRSRDSELFDQQVDTLENARAQINLIGSLPVRAWAYRCRLAVTMLDRGLTEGDVAKSLHHRAKLHEAIAQFVTAARAELGIDTRTAVVPEHTALGSFADTAPGHLEWLTSAPEPPALEASIVPRTELSP